MKYPDDHDNTVPPDKRGGVHAKPPVKEKPAHIPAWSYPVAFALPNEWADALMEMYPDMDLSKAVKRHILLTITPRKGDSL